MGRPYILVQKEILTEIEDLYFKGVPVAKLVRDYNLTMSVPTLHRLLNYLTIANRSLGTSATIKTINDSLFPPWLDEKDTDEVIQPKNWFYDGTMPLGKWFAKEK